MSRCSDAPAWSDLGVVPAEKMHALYTGLTATIPPDAPPRILWLINGEDHLSIGAGQDAANDLDLDRCRAQGIPVLRRPLGGGAIWLTAGQPCFMVILPRRSLTRGHRHLFALGSGLAVATLRYLGLPAVTTRGQDVCASDRKIMGTGAATILEGCVFGASFLCRFPAERFVSFLRLSSDSYRSWVLEALREGVTDIEQESGKPPPSADQVRTALYSAVAQRFGMEPESTPVDAVAIEQWVAIGKEEIDDLTLGDLGPSVPSGIRINRRSHVFQTTTRCGELRIHVDNAGIRRVWCEEPRIQQILQEKIIGLVPERLVLRARLNRFLDPDHADEVSSQIDALYRGIRNR